MIIVKTETIYLSENEIILWDKFYEFLEGIRRGCDNPEIQECLDDVNSALINLANFFGEEEE